MPTRCSKSGYTASDPQSAVFVERPRTSVTWLMRTSGLPTPLSPARSFAIGHGCSVTWAASHLPSAPPNSKQTLRPRTISASLTVIEIDAKALTLRFATMRRVTEVISSLRGCVRDMRTGSR